MRREEDHPPPATGVRRQWWDMPLHVRAAVEQWLGAEVVSAASQPTGFSPGVAARLRTSDGRGVFVKAVGPHPNPDSPEIHRREATVVRALPADAPVPRLVWSLDDPVSGYVVLAFEDVEGWHPAQPWRTDELDRVLEALTGLHTILGSSPVPLRSATELFSTEIRGWRRLQESPPPGLDDWSRHHLDSLARLEESAGNAVAGDSLLHFDIRADNLLLTPDRVFFVDWPHACVGAGWVDLVGFAPSVAMQGGPEPEALLQNHPLCRGADPDAITATVAAVAGYFTSRSLQSPPPGLPTIRAFQAAQGKVARGWLAKRTRLQ